MNFKFKIVVLTVLIAIFASCSNYNKVMKEGTKEEKYDLALELYEKEDYYRALQVFDELIVLYRGDAKIHDIYYRYAYSYYHQNELLLASYHFKYFAKTFPQSKYAEECYYMSAYCKYKSSTDYNLDQSSTKEAINEMQLFINLYPNSDKVKEANNTIDELREKLIIKDFKKASLYYETEYFRSAVYALKQHITDYPSSKFKEEAYLLAIKASYKYAENSVKSKQAERYKDTLVLIDEYFEKEPNATLAEDVNKIKEQILNKLDNF
jgi:outer membrane protein assembly factor BamD